MSIVRYLAKFVDKKLWKYSGVILFLIITFISVVPLTIEKVSPSQSVGTDDIQNVEHSSTDTEATLEDLRREGSIISDTFGKVYDVVRVVDGDTLDISIDGKVERVRLIGINTPETVDPRKPVECFGVEASNKAKELLIDKKVVLESDSSQGDRDKYDRLLRYVFLEDGTNINLLLVKSGYAYEYTYNLPYRYQAEFKEAQKYASTRKSGLWGDTCSTLDILQPDTLPETALTQVGEINSCTIKGNISSDDEKIFHVIGCDYYNKTVIDESKGERWFCSEQDALAAGWRKALNCN